MAQSIETEARDITRKVISSDRSESPSGMIITAKSTSSIVQIPYMNTVSIIADWKKWLAKLTVIHYQSWIAKLITRLRMLVNLLGKPLKICGCSPKTGWYLDGYCKTDQSDFGNHSICSVVTETFLKYTNSQGNNLVDPNPLMGFPGLKAGDHWCLCASRWEQARIDGVAPPVIMESTNLSAVQVIPLDILKSFSWKII